MDDIPLSDVVTAQPGANAESGNVANGEPVLTGTGPLRTAESLLVKQRIRACELLSMCTMCEVSL